MSEPLFTIGDGTDRQLSVLRSRDGSLCFEFWDTDVSNACVDYDWESSRVFVEKDEEDKLFQELLKKQYRKTLLWALLEEMAGEVVEVQQSPWGVTMISHGRASIRLQDNREGQREDTVNIRVHEARFIPDLILCLARAIQEQRKREVEVLDV